MDYYERCRKEPKELVPSKSVMPVNCSQKVRSRFGLNLHESFCTVISKEFEW